MQLRDHYDWVVLGDHPAALLSGALAARLGLSVLMVPLVPGFGIRVSKTGQHLDPESNFVLGAAKNEAAGLLWECLTKLGMLPAEEEMFLVDAAAPQVITPHARLTLHSNLEILKAELQREFGKVFVDELGLVEALAQARSSYQSFWRGLPERMTVKPSATAKEMRSMRASDDLDKRLKKALSGTRNAKTDWIQAKKSSSQLSHSLRAPQFQQLLSGLWYAVSGTPQTDPNISRLLQLLALAPTGASFRGGMGGYREFLLRLGQRHGAHWESKAECKRIFIENGRFVGVQLSQRAEMIAVRGGALGSAYSQAEELFSASGRKWLRARPKTPKPVGWKFTVSLTVNEEAIVPGMSRRMLWQESGGPVIEAEIANSAEYGSSQKEQRTIFLRTVLPFTQETLAPGYQRLVASRMVRAFMAVAPFVEYHIVRVFPDFREPPSDGGAGPEFSQTYSMAVPEAIPENLRCYEGEGSGTDSGIDGLFVTNGEAFPELGTLGGTVAAVEAVAWLAHRSGLAGPLA